MQVTTMLRNVKNHETPTFPRLCNFFPPNEKKANPDDSRIAGYRISIEKVFLNPIYAINCTNCCKQSVVNNHYKNGSTLNNIS